MNLGEPRHTKRVRRPLLRVATACALVAGLVALAGGRDSPSPHTASATVARPLPLPMNAGQFKDISAAELPSRLIFAAQVDGRLTEAKVNGTGLSPTSSSLFFHPGGMRASGA